MGLFVAIAMAVAVALIFLLPRDWLIADMEPGAFIAQAAYGLLAILFAAALVHRYRDRFGAALRDALLWVAIAIVLVALYAYRDALAPVSQRIMAEFNPGSVITPSPGVAEVVRRRDGQFAVSMQANGVALPFIFDTGASTVTLRAEDARRIGIDTSKLRFDEVVSTANGVTRAALAQIATLSVGTITQTRVRALVAQPGALHANLLGQNFLERLASYEVEGDRLVLRGR
jgi:aspartyl protease family protein